MPADVSILVVIRIITKKKNKTVTVLSLLYIRLLAISQMKEKIQTLIRKIFSSLRYWKHYGAFFLTRYIRNPMLFRYIYRLETILQQK